MNPHIIAVIYTSTEDKEITCIKDCLLLRVIE